MGAQQGLAQWIWSRSPQGSAVNFPCSYSYCLSPDLVICLVPQCGMLGGMKETAHFKHDCSFILFLGGG